MSTLFSQWFLCKPISCSYSVECPLWRYLLAEHLHWAVGKGQNFLNEYSLNVPGEMKNRKHIRYTGWYNYWRFVNHAQLFNNRSSIDDMATDHLFLKVWLFFLHLSQCEWTQCKQTGEILGCINLNAGLLHQGHKMWQSLEVLRYPGTFKNSNSVPHNCDGKNKKKLCCP